MVKKPQKPEPKKSYLSAALMGLAGAVTALVGVVQTHAQAAGLALDANVITGAKAGLVDSAASLTSTVNNQYFVEFALLFIGFAVAVGFVAYMVKGHRKI